MLKKIFKAAKKAAPIIGAGLGYLYAYVDNESDFGRGDVKFTSVNPFRVYVPPTSRDRFFDDADSIILSTILTEEQVLRLYPELGPQLDPKTGEMVDGLIKDISTHSDEDYPSPQNKNSIYKSITDSSGPDENILFEYYVCKKKKKITILGP